MDAPLFLGGSSFGFFILAGPVPIGTFTLRTYSRWLVYISRHPYVGAPRALESDEIDLGHDTMRYITNRDIPQLFDDPVLTYVYLIGIYLRFTKGDDMFK